MEKQKTYTLNDAHLHFARAANGEIWALLEKPVRTRDEDAHLLAAAFASYYHWSFAGREVHLQRAEYMIARAFLALGNPREAMLHAARCLEMTRNYPDQMADFDLAYAQEMMARAHAAIGQLELARKFKDAAQMAGEQIQNQEDREIFFADLADGNWYGLQPPML